MNPDELRVSMPSAVRGTAYLNTGASGPSPRPVRDAMEEALDAHAEAHLDSPYMYESRVASETRDAVASFVGAPPERVALTSNTTNGINTVADCFDPDGDDTVVTTALEHPAGVLPWQRLAETRRTNVRTVPAATDGDGLDRDAYKDAVDGAALVCLSSVSWYGVSVPVAQLVDVAHDTGASVVVDAAQSVGVEDVDVTDWGAEYVAFPAHKWLLGSWGAGFLYVASDAPSDGQERVGYKSTVSPNDSPTLHDDARRFEVSTSSPSVLAGARAGVETVRSVGLKTVEKRVSSLTDRLEDRLGDRHLTTGCGLVRFSDPTPEGTAERLKNEGVVIRSLPNGDLRASLHVFNTPEDVDRLAEAL
ncbi:aminotransferase class V-fold PLP-dependent enzyme [Haladaptatus sp. F3-133]|uniref:Aminotransferase class V-fold PLP-dependent enzyme n=1 Tax=Halorutilus salinus TaxID=2487751 RepID=A0A9Q4GH73_9EURY|nr:aminotransferase class V-fold PLP-dependent enzyme [Halorutilus salinus]MCX2818510.1 aminotransferase class V-fold PLP-dependent enzyme [Halorutilus salinus]